MTWRVFDQSLHDTTNLLTNDKVSAGVTLTYSCTLTTLQAESQSSSQT